MPELKRNILNFGYGINFEYEEKLSHSFNRFYVVTTFVLPTIKDLKFLPIKFDSMYSYKDVDINRSKFPTQYFPNNKNILKKIIPFINFYKKQIDSYNQTVHEIFNKRNFFDTAKISKR